MKLTISRRNSSVAMLPLLVLAACTGSKSTSLPVGTSPLGCTASASTCNILSGYSGNSTANGVDGATIAGGGQRGAPNHVTADFGTVGGGEANTAGEGSTVSGGALNTAINFHATVGGGAENMAVAQEATIAGGYKNTASQRFSTVGGGALNVASHLNATVAGGSANTASFTFATVGGGTQNSASSTAAVVAGGEHNSAGGTFSSILGGLHNDAAGYLSIAAGGAGNVASGSYSSVLGGFANVAAGDYSVAFGRTAHVRTSDPGTFIFADSSVGPFTSESPNEFAVRATGGVRIVTAVDSYGAPLSGLRLDSGAGAWETLSDRNAKSGLAPVDGQAILDGLMQLPIQTWSYRTQDPSIRHLGPTAQDFSAAFNLGGDGRYISTVDADGVALASVQQLYRLWQASELADSGQEVQALRQQVAQANVLALIALALAAWSLVRHRATP